MDKRMFKSLLLLISFTAVLVFVIIKIDTILSVLGSMVVILNPLLIGFALAFILNRPNMFFVSLYKKLLSKSKIKKAIEPLAICTTFIILIICIGVIMAFVIPQLTSSVQLLVTKSRDYLTGMQTFIADMTQRLHLKNLDLTKLDSIYNSFISGLNDIAVKAVPNILTFTTSIVSFLFTIIIAFIFSIYMLVGKQTLIRQVKSLVYAYLPENASNNLTEFTKLVADTFTKYVAGQILFSIILGFLCFFGMLIFGFSYPLLISIIITVTALIPVIGSYIGCSLSFLLLLMVSPTSALWFLLFIFILQQSAGSFVYPRIVGGSIGLPGIWVLLAVTVGGSMFGFPGMILSVPVASLLYTLLKRSVAYRLEKKQIISK
jgi:predicted PurR-regulated permease PerM